MNKHRLIRVRKYVPIPFFLFPFDKRIITLYHNTSGKETYNLGVFGAKPKHYQRIFSVVFCYSSHNRNTIFHGQIVFQLKS